MGIPILPPRGTKIVVKASGTDAGGALSAKICENNSAKTNAAETKKQVILMKGLGVSPGIAIGKAYEIERGAIEAAQFCYLDQNETDREIERFKNALKESRDQLTRIKKKMEEDRRGKEHIRIIDAHIIILKDAMLINDTVKVIKKKSGRSRPSSRT